MYEIRCICVSTMARGPILYLYKWYYARRSGLLLPLLWLESMDLPLL